jgi:ketosteroid isomerase-like protein
MSATNKNRVIEMWQAFSTRDPSKIEPFLASGAVWTAPPGNATAKFFGQVAGMKGRDEIIRFILEDFRKLFSRDVKIDFKGVYADGDTVVTEQTLSATLANGRHYQNDYCFVHALKDGQVVEIREFMDTYNGHRMIFGEAAAIS